MAKVSRKGNELRELIHKNDNCVGCGICADLCPTTAIRLGPVLPIARGIIDMDLISINHDKCVLCGLCSNVCIFNALELTINGKKTSSIDNYPVWEIGTSINDDECILCGKCEKYCPRNSIFVKRQLPKLEDLVIGEIKTEVDKCINCQICVEMCPNEAISIQTGNDCKKNELTPTGIDIDKSKCVYCKICQKVCPEDALQIFCTTCMKNDTISPVEIEGMALLDNETCVNCGWCESICPTSAITTNKPFTGEVVITETEENFCKGSDCNACLDVCPCNAITLDENNKAVFNNTVCNLCGACSKVCPQRILTINRTSIALNNIKSIAWKNIINNLTQ
ncbi:MAG: 4Fe-4S binding protein [Methanobrevibacter sp.]|jgi:4Fe-4S ferredoxin|nr:4Fe-4S binding protein [Candidatus Methanoflexus mossambicus]